MSESGTEGTPTPDPTKVETPGPATVEVKPPKSETDQAAKLQAEVDKWKALSRKNEETARANADAAKRLAQIEEANASDLEKAIKKAREEGAAEVMARANTRLVASEARALAAQQRFIDPTDAIKLVDLSGIRVNEDGSVDTDTINKLLTELAERKPQYLVQDTGPRRPRPDDAQGQPPAPPAASTATPGMGRLREAYAQAKP